MYYVQCLCKCDVQNKVHITVSTKIVFAQILALGVTSARALKNRVSVVQIFTKKVLILNTVKI